MIKMRKEQEGEYPIAKENRRKRQEAEEGTMVVHLPPSSTAHLEKRKIRDRKIRELVKKIRKKH
jgi:hypothetical protein